MSTLKVNEIDSKTGTTVSIAPTKTLDVPAGAAKETRIQAVSLGWS